MLKIFTNMIVFVVAFSFSIANAAVTNGQKFDDWEATCNKENHCQIAQIAKNKDGTPVGKVSLEIVKNQPVAVIGVPLGVTIEAGLGIAVDSKLVARVRYKLCDPVGCYVIIPLKSEFANKLKAGKTLEIITFWLDKQQTVDFSLKGITKAINAL